MYNNDGIRHVNHISYFFLWVLGKYICDEYSYIGQWGSPLLCPFAPDIANLRGYKYFAISDLILLFTGWNFLLPGSCMVLAMQDNLCCSFWLLAAGSGT